MNAHFRNIAIAAVALIGMAQTAHAQLIAGPGTNAVPTKAQDRKPAEQPPSALPGSAVDKELVTPLEKSNADLPPNEALFDAINRGDIGSARDAINRGADTDAHNILGMSPLELSVDLSRQDITFLLLSLRGTGSSGSRGPAAGPSSSVLAKAGPKGKRGQDAAQVKLATAKPAAAAAPMVPKKFAGDGGTALPNVGFLGFDAGRNGTVR